MKFNCDKRKLVHKDANKFSEFASLHANKMIVFAKSKLNQENATS